MFLLYIIHIYTQDFNCIGLDKEDVYIQGVFIWSIYVALRSEWMAWAIIGNLHIDGNCGTFRTLTFYMETVMNEAGYVDTLTFYVDLFMIESGLCWLSAYEMLFSSLTLRSLQQLSRVNHELCNVNVAMRSWIIVLGIRHQPRPYQCPHAGTTLFGRIHALVMWGHMQ